MKVFYLIERQEHLTDEGFIKIVAIKASMNQGLSDEFKLAFPDVVPVSIPKVKNKKISDSNWLAGFTSGEGCFYVKVRQISKYKTGFWVELDFKTLTTLPRWKINDLGLAKGGWGLGGPRSLIKYFQCGYINKVKTRPNVVNYIVITLTDITQRLFDFSKNLIFRELKKKILKISPKSLNSWKIKNI